MTGPFAKLFKLFKPMVYINGAAGVPSMTPNQLEVSAPPTMKPFTSLTPAERCALLTKAINDDSRSAKIPLSE